MSPVVVGNGCVTIVVGSEVLVVCLVVQHMPDGDEQLACDGHEDFHLVLPADLGLVVGEAAEETFLHPACSPGALYDGLAEEYIAVSDSARFVLSVGYVVSWLQPAP